jgi:hypothetical protein
MTIAEILENEPELRKEVEAELSEHNWALMNLMCASARVLGLFAEPCSGTTFECTESVGTRQLVWIAGASSKLPALAHSCVPPTRILAECIRLSILL